VIGTAGTLLLMNNRKVPAMFVLLAFALVVGAIQQPQVLAQIAQTSIGFRMPHFALGDIGWNQFFVGAVLLALPQVPLTLGNAVIAVTQENNRLFPERPVSEGKVAVSTGLMNLFGASVGGIPMCHGAGGMAAHTAFGARTGGAVVILGGLLLVLALFFSGSIEALFKLFPVALLGVVLFIAGLQLAIGNSVLPEGKTERAIVIACAAVCMWNVGIGFLVGIALHHLHARGWLKF
jgi:MFS superfamily sulfate permease-like transporter